MINWLVIPFVRLLLPILLGVVTGAWLDRPLPYVWVAGLVLLPFLYYFANRRGDQRGNLIFGVLLSVFLFGFGLWRASTHNETQRASYFDPTESADSLRVIGRVIDLPEEKAKSVRVLLNIDYRKPDSSYQRASGHCLIYLEKDSQALALKSGDILAAQLTPRPVEPVRNPEAFDYRRYLERQHIHRQAYLRGDAWTRLDSGLRLRPTDWCAPLRLALLAILREHLPTTETFSVGSALILGYKAEIDERIRTSYANTGAMHVLAVSGLHVGLVYVIVSFLLRQIWPPRRSNRLKQALLLAGIIWGFALLTGASPSVLRAATMFTLIAVGKAYRFQQYLFNTLAITAVFWLIIDPYLLFNVGFQLSYLAVGGIVYWQRRVYKLLVFYNDILDAAWKLTSVSIAAQIMTLPISLFYFHQFPVYFWLSGLIVIPAASVVLSLGLGLFALHWVPYVGMALGKLLYGIIALVNALIFFVEALPGSVVQGIWISGGVVLAMYVFLYLLIYTGYRREGRWVVVSCVGLLFFVGASSFVELRTHHQRRATIYHLHQYSLLDIMEGKALYSYSSENAATRDISFAAQNHRWKRRAVPVQERIFSDTASVDLPFLKRQHVWQLADRRLVRIDAQTPVDTLSTLATDYLWISGAPRAAPAEVLRAYPAKRVILDGAVPAYLRSRWRAYLAASGLPVHDTAEHGAFTFSY